MHLPWTTLRRHRFSDSHRKAFTLLELLIVVALISILAYLVVPALSSLTGAQAVNEGIYEVSSTLQLARSEAVSRQTYVWVGFQQSTVNGLPQMNMVIASSRDGSTNYVGSNLVNLAAPVRVRGVVLTNWSGLKTVTSGLFTNGAPVSIGGTGTAGVNFPTATTSYVNTVTFTPRGEAMQKLAPGPDDPYDAFLDVSFRQSNTGTPAANANDASVVIEGATGAVQTVRIQ